MENLGILIEPDERRNVLHIDFANNQIDQGQDAGGPASDFYTNVAEQVHAHGMLERAPPVHACTHMHVCI